MKIRMLTIDTRKIRMLTIWAIWHITSREYAMMQKQKEKEAIFQRTIAENTRLAREAIAARTAAQMAWDICILICICIYIYMYLVPASVCIKMSYKQSVTRYVVLLRPAPQHRWREIYVPCDVGILSLPFSPCVGVYTCIYEKPWPPATHHTWRDVCTFLSLPFFPCVGVYTCIHACMHAYTHAPTHMQFVKLCLRQARALPEQAVPYHHYHNKWGWVSGFPTVSQ